MTARILNNDEVNEAMNNRPTFNGHAAHKTTVLLALERSKHQDLISRSQAKRVLSRFERFREVLLDFKGVSSIGQAFADEIFRVFKQSHPDVVILAINTTPEVDKMISRAKSIENAPSSPNSPNHKDGIR